ncbi:MAG: nucleoside triphosphate pyrophosphohydrolase [Cyanobacteria bacterium SZAS LIN-3]|nr:nucleoside triphosphate pyrophosphohydrolase [Cyanobacteria bacterium SZAS LIN-3]MBS2008844.1 nucleoside triphosphate pyrophosphohydrolase [Cyanobacteria bacterium SZAS TMP-1]
MEKTQTTDEKADAQSSLEAFVGTIARLRAPDGCPWDREQTHKTLARYLLEETYEVLDAIHQEDPRKLKEELGDLLLQIVLNAQVAKDGGHFDMEDVAAAINAKMIRRHPHVFADTRVKDASEVVSNWQEIKEQEKREEKERGREEGKDHTEHASALDGIPRSMPALMQALKISEKAVHEGFEWYRESDVWDKLYSEIAELKEAISNPDLQEPLKAPAARDEIALEFGDILFCLVNLTRWHALDPEQCLLLTIEKFKTRYRAMEQISGAPLRDLSKERLNDLWEEAKVLTKKKAE